jgi:Domain of unknown function (DUF4145)
MRHKMTATTSSTAPMSAALRCPYCHYPGAFPGLRGGNDVTWQEQGLDGASEQWCVGMRRCPNSDCQSLVFVVLVDGQLRESFPPQIIDFDSSNLPPRLLETLEEAVKCHAAGCYKACALMVRRLLEELCKDKQAEGKDLKDRIAALSSKIVVPQELLSAAHDLRLLGNDAAHVEAKDYDAIGKDEAMLAVELAKLLLNGVYQYSILIDKLKARKKPSRTTITLGKM